VKVNAKSSRQDCDMAQVALNRPRTPVAWVLWSMLMLFGCAAVVAIFLLAAR